MDIDLGLSLRLAIQMSLVGGSDEVRSWECLTMAIDLTIVLLS